MLSFIGLGNMGALIAECLLRAGQELRVFDLSPEARAALAAEGAAAAPSVREAVDGTDVAVLCLPNSRIVEEVVTGPDGLLSAERPPRVVVDCTSAEPLASRDLAGRLAEHGIGFVDAPVSGGLMAARRAALTAMVGGEPGTVESVRPVLEAFTSYWSVAGPVGAGHATKAINNYLSSASFLLTSEAVLAGRALGAATVPLIEAFASGETRSQNSEVKFPAFVAPRRFDAGFAMGLEAKDVDIAFGIGTRAERATPLASASRALWLLAERELGASADFTSVYGLLERWSGLPPAEPGGAAGGADPALVDTLAFALATSLREATLEALALVAALGLDPAPVFALISRSTGRNVFTTRVEEGAAGLPRVGHPRLDDGEARAEVRALLRRSRTPAPMTSIVFGLDPSTGAS